MPKDANRNDAEALARRVAEAMYPKDRAAHLLGIEIREVGPGTATLTMTVTEDMLNGHDTCHGGMLFTLADTAFAYACNAHNNRTVAQHCSVTFLRPAYVGSRLVATAVERFLEGRNGIYDICVRDEHGTAVAEFRGHSRRVEGALVAADDGA